MKNLLLVPLFVLSSQLIAEVPVVLPLVSSGIASKYVGDTGIENDPSVLFVDNFETGEMKKWDDQRGPVVLSEASPNTGR